MLKFLIDRFFIKQPRLRSAVTRLMFGSADRPVSLFGRSFVVNSERENGYLRAAKKMTSSSLLSDETGVLLSLATLLEPGDTFVDVGANVGIFCCTLSRINAINGAKVVRFYAYEPHPDTFSRLQRNAVGTNIEARNVAAGEIPGTNVRFVDGAVSHVFTRVDKASAYNIASRTLEVAVVCLEDEAIEGDSIVLKIDVEQQELSVLRGARRWFEQRRVKAVYVDNYDDNEEIDTFLTGYGFKLKNGRTVDAPFRSGFALLAVSPEKLRSRAAGY